MMVKVSGLVGWNDVEQVVAVKLIWLSSRCMLLIYPIPPHRQTLTPTATYHQTIYLHPPPLSSLPPPPLLYLHLSTKDINQPPHPTTTKQSFPNQPFLQTTNRQTYHLLNIQPQQPFHPSTQFHQSTHRSTYPITHQSTSILPQMTVMISNCRN